MASKGIVVYYTNLEKDRFEDLLSGHGFDNAEFDISSDGEWHDGYRDLGKVAFWKNNMDGVVINHVKFNIDGKSNVHGTGVHAVGNTYNYFKELGFVSRYKFFERKETINMNGRDLDAIGIDSCEFEDFLQMPNVRKLNSIMGYFRSSSVNKEGLYPDIIAKKLQELKALKESGLRLPVNEIKSLVETIYDNGIERIDLKKTSGKPLPAEYKKELSIMMDGLKGLKSWWQIW